MEEISRGFKKMLAWSNSFDLDAKDFLIVSKCQSEKPQEVEAYPIQWDFDVKRIKEMTGMSESLKDHFLFFSSKYYANHPW